MCKSFGTAIKFRLYTMLIRYINAATKNNFSNIASVDV